MNDILHQSLKRFIKQMNTQLEEEQNKKDTGNENDEEYIVDKILETEFMGKTLLEYFIDTNFIEKRAIAKELLQSKYSGRDTDVEWVVSFMIDEIELRSMRELELFFTDMEELLTDTLRENVMIYDKAVLSKKAAQIFVAIIAALTITTIALCFVEYSGRLFEQLVILAVVSAIGVKFSYEVINSYKEGCEYNEKREREIRGEQVE